MSDNLNIRILENGPDDGWYWEVVTHDKAVIARGVAGRNVVAREQAAAAARDWNRAHWNAQSPDG